MVLFIKLYCLAYKLYFGWTALQVVFSILGVISDVHRYGGTDWRALFMGFLSMFVTWLVVTILWAIGGGCMVHLYTKMTGRTLPPGTIR
jgi:hypothetical protein